MLLIGLLESKLIVFGIYFWTPFFSKTGDDFPFDKLTFADEIGCPLLLLALNSRD